jgi:hypothetical protein
MFHDVLIKFLIDPQASVLVYTAHKYIEIHIHCASVGTHIGGGLQLQWPNRSYGQRKRMGGLPTLSNLNAWFHHIESHGDDFC